MRHLIIIFFVILNLYSCSRPSKFLKDIYSNDFTIKNMIEKDTINDYFSDDSECGSVVKSPLKFIIRHEKNYSLKNLYFNIFLGQKKIFSGEYVDIFKTEPIKLCINKKSGNFLTITALDKINNIYYSWGQKNSIELNIRDVNKIILLQKEDNDGNNFIIEK